MGEKKEIGIFQISTEPVWTGTACKAAPQLFSSKAETFYLHGWHALVCYIDVKLTSTANVPNWSLIQRVSSRLCLLEILLWISSLTCIVHKLDVHLQTLAWQHTNESENLQLTQSHQNNFKKGYCSFKNRENSGSVCKLLETVYTLLLYWPVNFRGCFWNENISGGSLTAGSEIQSAHLNKMRLLLSSSESYDSACYCSLACLSCLS